MISGSPPWVTITSTNNTLAVSAYSNYSGFQFVETSIQDVVNGHRKETASLTRTGCLTTVSEAAMFVVGFLRLVLRK